MYSINLEEKLKNQGFYWELSYEHQQWLGRVWGKAKKLYRKDADMPEYYILGHDIVAPWLVANHGKEFKLSEIEGKIKEFCTCPRCLKASQ